MAIRNSWYKWKHGESMAVNKTKINNNKIAMDAWFLRKSNLNICQEIDKYELDGWKRRIIRCLRVWPCNGENRIGQIFKFDLLKNVTLNKKILFYAFVIKFTYILQIFQIDFLENQVPDAHSQN